MKTNCNPSEAARVLLVDDDAEVLEATADALALLGYEPAPYACGLEALEAFRAGPASYRMLITDLNMPGISGTELVIKARELRSDLPCILTTGSDGRPADAPPDLAMLSKPYRIGELASHVRTVLDGRHAASEGGLA
jgi:CheY-like chemotaxis protein